MTVLSSFDTNAYFIDTTEGVGNIQKVLTADSLVSGGTFRLEWNGEFTTPLDWDATAAEMQAALNALTSINGTGSVSAVGGPLNAATITVSFTSVPGSDMTLLGVDSSNLE